MRKYFTILILAFLFAEVANYASTFTVTNSGYTFSPSVLTIYVGDTVTFSLASMHNAVEVNESVWNADGNTSNGGFSVPYGGGTVTFKTAGVFYYVCQAHAYLGMKGKITVLNLTDLPENNVKTGSILKVFPNPAKDYINVDFLLSNNSKIKIDLIDITGQIDGTLLNAEYQAGEHSEKLYIPKVNSGKYFLRYSYNNQYFVKPIIIYGIK